MLGFILALISLLPVHSAPLSRWAQAEWLRARNLIQAGRGFEKDGRYITYMTAPRSAFVQMAQAEDSGRLLIVAFPVPVAATLSASSLCTAEADEFPWVKVTTAGEIHHLSVRELNGQLYVTECHWRSDRTQVTWDSNDRRHLFVRFADSDGEFHAPTQMEGEILRFHIDGDELRVRTSAAMAYSFVISQQNGKLKFELARYRTRLLSQRDLLAESRVFSAPCDDQLTTPR
jgi:hypothetical protein